REELGAVLGQPPVAGLHVTELALDDPERMFDLRPDAGDDAVDPRVERMQLAGLRCLAHDAPDLARPPEPRLALGADIALVRPDRILVAVQKRIPDLTVVDPRRRGIKAVGHAAVGIDADVRLHAEIPLVALLGGGHFWVASAGLVLGRGWRIDNRRIDQRA